MEKPMIQHIRKLVAPFYYEKRLNIPSVYSLFEEYLRRDNWSRERLLTFQMEKLKDMLIYARDNTRYYQRLFSDCNFNPATFESPEQLNVLPPLTKKDVRANLDDLLSSAIPEDQRHHVQTGGTSRVQMDLYRDNACRAHRFAAQWRGDTWAGWQQFSNLGFVWVAIRDFVPKTSLKMKLANLLATGTRIFYAFSLNEEKCDRIIRQLQRFKPTLIRCFPSPMTSLAEYAVDKGIRIPCLRGIVSTGEPLYEHQQDVIEKAFGINVYNLYASREVGTTAAQCDARRDLHIAADSLFVEAVDDNFQQVANGIDGELLITDLHNYALPLIRYAVGDHGRMINDECICGRPYPLMKNIVGRVTDNFIDAEGNTVATISLSHYLIAEGPKVGQVQLIQNSPTEITVRITNDPPPDDSTKQFYINRLTHVMKGLKNVRFEIVDKIEAEKSGKFRFAICNLSNDDIARLKKAGAHR